MAVDQPLYPSWEFLECDGEVPQSRSGHTCALHKNRFLYIFGGFDGSNCFDDLYVLDLDSRSWRKIEAGGECPSGRASHSAVTDEFAGVMYVFGGSGSHFGYTNKRDLCEFCFETETWRLLSNPTEDTPSARYGQSMVAYQEGLYVWGGTHGTNYPTDMHRFDLCSKQWEYVVTTGDLPCGRYRHQAMVHEDLMYIVGGSGINRYGDVFTFHFGTCVWRKLVCTGTDLSDGRYAHSAVLREDYIYLYGGNDGVRHDDLQQLDLDTRVWSRVSVHGQCPPGRDFHAAVLRKDSMVIFGGSSGMRRHNDVFEFHLAPKIPMCTLSADLEALLEQCQADEASMWSCDVFLAADDGETTQGVYCHSHLLLVRCPALYQQVQEHLPARTFPPIGVAAAGQDAASAAVAVAAAAAAPTGAQPISASDASRGEASQYALPEPLSTPLGDGTSSLQRASMEERPSTVGGTPGTGALNTGAGRDHDETIDSLIRAVVTEDPSGKDVSNAGRHGRCPPAGWGTGWPVHSHCAWVPIDMPHTILWHFVRYLYCETTKFGRLSAEHLYRLFLASKIFEVPRLAALCERQLKVRLGLDNVLPLLRMSTQDGPAALPIQEACKHFFLANYNHCTELRECEVLDPKLLCEIMRLHNSRAAPSLPSQQAPRSAGASGPASMAPLSPQPPVRVNSMAEEPGVRGSKDSREGTAHEVPVPPETLTEDLKRLLIEEIAPDFEVVVQDEVIRAHRFMLVARSGYFASCILTSGMVEAQAGRLVIPAPSAMTADAFRAFLRFLYAGDDILGVLAPPNAMYLVDASSFYGLTNSRLKYHCELCVKDSFNEEHVLQLFEASSRLNVEAVRSMALEFIISQFHTVCRQPALEQLDKPLLVDILKGLADRLPAPSIASPGPSVPQSLG